MYIQQRTIAKPISCSGIGVHSGKMVNLTIKPAPENNGIKFIRVDLPNSPIIPALFKMVVDTSLATVIGKDGAIVSTIEHLMASFAGLSIENAMVELDSYEMPIMDGSAAFFTELIKKAGIKTLRVPRQFFVIKEPIVLEEEERSVAIYPAPVLKITCTIEYSHPLIQRQTHTIELSDHNFESEIAPARTFGFIQDIEYLKQYGLGRGASLESGIAISNDRILNEEGLRYPDEFVRHKILDCLGDFSLLGLPLLGHIIAHKSGHSFHHAFLQQFFSSKHAWETSAINRLDQKNSDSLKSLAM